MTANLVNPPFHTAPGQGVAIWHLGALLTFKATSAATGGRCWAKEMLAPRGAAPARHVHTHEDEAFYVLDGEVSVYIGEEVTHASPGSFLWAPRGVSHTFCVESDTARVLVFSTGHFDRFFLETGTSAATPTLPPPLTEPPELDALIAAAQEYGVTTVGPPPVPRHHLSTTAGNGPGADE
jgi:quercetin dioxygenase-like cupin family protein